LFSPVYKVFPASNSLLSLIISQEQSPVLRYFTEDAYQENRDNSTHSLLPDSNTAPKWSDNKQKIHQRKYSPYERNNPFNNQERNGPAINKGIVNQMDQFKSLAHRLKAEYKIDKEKILRRLEPLIKGVERRGEDILPRLERPRSQNRAKTATKEGVRFKVSNREAPLDIPITPDSKHSAKYIRHSAKPIQRMTKDQQIPHNENEEKEKSKPNLSPVGAVHRKNSSLPPEIELVSEKAQVREDTKVCFEIYFPKRLKRHVRRHSQEPVLE